MIPQERYDLLQRMADALNRFGAVQIGEGCKVKEILIQEEYTGLVAIHPIKEGMYLPLNWDYYEPCEINLKAGAKFDALDAGNYFYTILTDIEMNSDLYKVQKCNLKYSIGLP